ncbi:hypothetical protein HYU13_06000 [Candidatus Woesearchaeota archaeon]|nr:hypothetical protein [Candidatus Woesearchaeota archaeon]
MFEHLYPYLGDYVHSMHEFFGEDGAGAAIFCSGRRTYFPVKISPIPRNLYKLEPIPFVHSISGIVLGNPLRDLASIAIQGFKGLCFPNAILMGTTSINYGHPSYSQETKGDRYALKIYEAVVPSFLELDCGPFSIRHLWREIGIDAAIPEDISLVIQISEIPESERQKRMESYTEALSPLNPRIQFI